MLLEPIKMLLDYSHKNQLNTNYQEISGEIIKAYKINDKTALYLNANKVTLSGFSYFEDIDLYYSTGLFITLGEVNHIKNEKEIIIKIYEKLTSVSLFEYLLSPAYDNTLDFDFNVTKLIKEVATNEN